MHMAAVAKVWTLEELHSLPDDGNTYELIHGELFVTPAPMPSHEVVLTRLMNILFPYDPLLGSPLFLTLLAGCVGNRRVEHDPLLGSGGSCRHPERSAPLLRVTRVRMALA